MRFSIHCTRSLWRQVLLPSAKLTRAKFCQFTGLSFQFAAASAELGRLEQELNDFSQCSPEQMDFERCREELDKLDKENERLKEEILQIQDSNSELRKSRLALLAEGEEEFWKEQQTAKEEETRMAHELELLVGRVLHHKLEVLGNYFSVNGYYFGGAGTCAGGWLMLIILKASNLFIGVSSKLALKMAKTSETRLYHPKQIHPH